MMKAVAVVLLMFAVAQVPAFADQTCDTSKYPLSSPTERFTDHGDGTVTDEAAQLMWMRCSAGQTWSDGSCIGTAATFDWQGAQQVAVDMNKGGSLFFNDWRLPSLRDLAMIAERQCENPRINLAVFPSTPAALYWTSSLRPGEGFDESAYVLSFGPEGVLHLPKDDRYLVRLVRTAP